MPDKDRSGIKQPTQLKQLNLNEISKPLWTKISRNDFISLIKDVVNNLDDKDYQTTVDKRKYDFKIAEKYLLEIIIKKISENDALKLYNSLVKPEVAALKKASSRGKNKRNKTLNILNNIESRFFEGLYLHYSNDNLEPETEEGMTERIKSRKQRSAEIANKEKKISLELFRKYFGYFSPSNMYMALNETKKLRRKQGTSKYNRK